jgi:hypothetical protein
MSQPISNGPMEDRDVNYDILPAINQFPANIAVLDLSGRIVSVNNGWKLFGAENGLRDPNSCIGADYLAACAASDVSPALMRDLEDLVAGRKHLIARWYPCHHPVAMKRWMALLGTRDEECGKITLSHVDVTSVVNHGMMESLTLD